VKHIAEDQDELIEDRLKEVQNRLFGLGME